MKKIPRFALKAFT